MLSGINAAFAMERQGPPDFADYPDYIVSKILPRWVPDSISSCAFAASAKSKLVKVVARNCAGAASKKGHAVFCRSAATADLKASGRDRNVDPVRVRRLSITGIRSISIFDP